MIKKFFALILCLIYLSASGVVYAYSELYYLYNVTPEKTASDVETVLQAKDFYIKAKNPYYAISNKNSQNYINVVLQPTGQDLFYYVESNKKISLNKDILKKLSSSGVSYKLYNSDSHLKYFAQLAENSRTGVSKTYSFDSGFPQSQSKAQIQPVQSAVNVQSSNNVANNSLHGYVAKLGAGTVLDVYLQNAINTATARVGDNVTAVLKSDWIVNNNIIAPQGSVVYGSLIKAKHASAGLQNGRVVIDFNNLVTPDGKSYKILTQSVDFDVTNEGKWQSSSAKIVSAAAFGALSGLLVALLCRNGNYARSAAIGAGVASGVSAISIAAEKGVDAEIPSFTELEIQVKENVSVMVNK